MLGDRNSEKSALYFVSYDKLSSELTSEFLQEDNLFKFVVDGRHSEKSALYFILYGKLSNELIFENFCQERIFSHL